MQTQHSAYVFITAGRQYGRVSIEMANEFSIKESVKK
jgi:hypothetical protein